VDDGGGGGVGGLPGGEPGWVGTVYMGQVGDVEPAADVLGDVLRIRPLWMVADAVDGSAAHEAADASGEGGTADDDDGVRVHGGWEVAGGEQQGAAAEDGGAAGKGLRLAAGFGDHRPAGA